jgi:gas vesicle protein
VSEVGYMMEEETLQLIIRHLNRLKTDIINDVRIDINTVYDGQEELKNDIGNRISAVKNDIENSISAVKNDIQNSISNVWGNIRALETKINAGQEELRQEISDFQENKGRPG